MCVRTHETIQPNSRKNIPLAQKLFKMGTQYWKHFFSLKTIALLKEKVAKQEKKEDDILRVA